MTERRKTALCLQWLHYCRSIGWTHASLAGLGDLFWKYEGWRTFKGWTKEEG